MKECENCRAPVGCLFGVAVTNVDAFHKSNELVGLAPVAADASTADKRFESALSLLSPL